MAFGKDRKPGPGKMDLRQQMRRSSQRAPRSSGGGGGAAWKSRYLPPLGQADTIRIIPGQYPMPRVDKQARDFYYDDNNRIITDLTPYWTYIEYFHGTKKRSCIGSEGFLGEFKGKGDPCIAADWFWWEWRQRNKNKSKHPNAMSRKEKYVFTVLVQAPFYKVPQRDERGEVKVNPNTKEPYYNWEQGSKKGNDELAASGYERKEGHLMHWSMTYGHWAILQDYTDNLAKSCVSCGGADTIEELALTCQNCGEAVVIMSETSLDDEDLTRLRTEEVMCPQCRHTGYLEAAVECSNCSDPEPATLFDFDLRVKRTPSTNSENGNQTVLQIIKALGPRPISDVYGEDLRTPLDLPKIFAPDTIERQEDLFGRPPGDDDVMTDVQRQPVNTGTRSYRRS